MITSVGEVLVDMIAAEEGSLTGVKLFEKHPGGAPANVAVGLARLGVPVSLVSKVGRDPFGDFLVERLRKEGVDVRHVLADGFKHTGVVFVQLKGAKPEFMLYDGVAYFNIRTEELARVPSSDLVHFGTVLFAREPSRSAVFSFLKRVREEGAILSYDVNLRRGLWREEGDMLRDVERAIRMADVIKVGDEEMKYLEQHGVNVISARLVAITMGERGCEIHHGGECVNIPAYPVNPVDTTGAGDAFMAALLAWLWRGGLSLSLNREEIEEMGKFANRIAALSTLSRGAWSVPQVKPQTLLV